MSREGKKGGFWKTILIILLAIILAYSVLMYAIPALEEPDLSAVGGSADWMARLGGDTPLGSVILPGTHDSATRSVQLAYFSKCQSLSIKSQLEAGFRFLDIRLGECDGGLKLMHGFTNCKEAPWPWSGALKLDKVLEECYSFLDEHPSETVVFFAKHEHGDMDDDAFLGELKKYIDRTPEKWFTGEELPLLSEARGKLVLVRRFAPGAQDAGVYISWEDQGGYDDPQQSIGGTEPGSLDVMVQDRYCYDAGEKWTAFMNGLAIDIISKENVLRMSFLSTKGHAKFGHPYKYAKTLNEKLSELEGGRLRGWVIVDFGTPKLAEKIYGQNF